MTTAREIMHSGARCVGEDETLQTAAQMMRDLRVGSLPICGRDDRLHGMLTDRDIVLHCCAEGRDAAEVTAGEVAAGTPHWVAADADMSEVLALSLIGRYTAPAGELTYSAVQLARRSKMMGVGRSWPRAACYDGRTSRATAVEVA